MGGGVCSSELGLGEEEVAWERKLGGKGLESGVSLPRARNQKGRMLLSKAGFFVELGVEEGSVVKRAL